ncbi:haloacid dehalogenase, type II [Clohesyomyces aquaticus]|uniref:Haloacid dehalogenase, type II n=1 Tax=Clohesyomyces aquaticus TaxID=1231657 RepID=A0A1Y1ZRV1_9PLEO|nr:haloacid dehalogenase, type II [Clohesyomyces aquaticus]
MDASTDIILAFDAYGTLLSTESIAKRLASHFGSDKAATIAQTWRKYQLEYTWRLNSMNKYEPFSSVTRNSLQHALAEASVSLDSKAIDSLMNAYNTLSLFPDVPPLFSHLESNPAIHAVVFSNGTNDMISASLSQSPDLSPHAHLFKDVVVVEPVQKFKPCPEVYQHLCKKVGKEGIPADVWLISGNPFDVVGANAIGMRSCWVDRSGAGWQDGLVEGEKGRPTVTVKGLDEVVGTVQDFVNKR